MRGAVTFGCFVAAGALALAGAGWFAALFGIVGFALFVTSGSSKGIPYTGPKVERAGAGPCISSGGMCFYGDDCQDEQIPAHEVTANHRPEHEPEYAPNRQGQMEEVGSATTWRTPVNAPEPVMKGDIFSPRDGARK